MGLGLGFGRGFEHAYAHQLGERIGRHLLSVAVQAHLLGVDPKAVEDLSIIDHARRLKRVL